MLKLTLTADDVFISAKIPFAFDYADGDADVYPSYSQHGTHVAGIISGQADSYTNKDGYTETVKDENGAEVYTVLQRRNNTFACRAAEVGIIEVVGKDFTYNELYVWSNGSFSVASINGQLARYLNLKTTVNGNETDTPVYYLDSNNANSVPYDFCARGLRRE